MYLLASAEAGKLLGDAGMTVIIGLVVVFSVLLLLTGIFWLFGKMMSAGKKNTNAPSAAPAAPAAPVATAAPVAPVAAAPIVGNTEAVASKPEVDGGVPEETVAVISAAVASVAPAGSQYAVRGIRKL